MTAANIAAALGDARREGRAWRCRCPLHGGRSLVLRDGDASLLVTCWAGCDRLDVLAELNARGLFSDRAECRPHIASPPRHDDRDDIARRVNLARRIWDATLPAPGSPVVRYLASRGISVPPPSLRWAPRCWHGGARAELPAMVSVVEHVDLGIVGIHRTYLRADGRAKAHLPRNQQKRTLGRIAGGAVRFGMPCAGEWFTVAEGIETTAAVVWACAMPGWAALSAGGIRALILPPEATHVVISADHDRSGTGERAAHDAAARWLAEGRRVRIAMPPERGTDMADLLSGIEETSSVAA
jgi:hypothetical protein